MFKKLDLHGISCIAPVPGSRGPAWYWGSDFASGDLYEAEELFRGGHPVRGNRLVFVRYPEGRVVEPIAGREGRYFGRPIFWDGKLHILLADFPRGRIEIHRYDDGTGQTDLLAAIPLDQATDCYNLLLFGSPLLLTRQGNDGKFQLLWPDRVEFPLEDNGAFLGRGEDGRLYFSRWFEEPDGSDYREEVVARRYPAGEVLEVIPGTLWEMPDGQQWILQ